ncbi:MAG: protein-methionine-sulfoxide reductase heme-binding subunit MsrQ [Caulobacteraceae bacterium]|nr:protein-methionine-sulfoxide reductase heme-binding subunit MsrQ [Caulobacteraceae bacterium]
MTVKPRSTPRAARDRLIYWTMWVVLALPLPITLFYGLTGPVRLREDMIRDLGLWGVRILILGLCITPAARLLRRPALLRYRRTVGLFGFAYAAVHGPYYFVYGRLWELPLELWARRLYFVIGIVSLLLLTPLAITSTDGMIRRLGPLRWRRLHQSTYAAMVLVGVHALWQASIDHTQPAIYMALIAALLIVRLPPVMRALTGRRRGRAVSRPGVASAPAD